MLDGTNKLKSYPVQARYIAVRELVFKAYTPPSPNITVSEEEYPYKISVGHSEYDPENKIIQVSVQLETEDGEPDQSLSGSIPYYIKVKLSGIFEIDDQSFPADRIFEWASTNAVFIFYPFLREHVFALTARGGFSPFILPLVEVPTIKVSKTEAPDNP